MAVRLLILAGLIATGVSADSVTYETFGNFSNLCFLGSNACGFDIQNVVAFNPALGTLDSATLTYSGREDVIVDIDNCGNPPMVGYSYTITASQTLQGTTLSDTESNSGSTFGSCAGRGSVGFSPIFQGTFPVTDPNSFIGTEDVADVPVSVSLTGSLEVYPFVGSAVYVENYYEDTSVTYSYTPVPEPRALTLLVFCCGCVLAARRRKRTVLPTT